MSRRRKKRDRAEGEPGLAATEVFAGHGVPSEPEVPGEAAVFVEAEAVAEAVVPVEPAAPAEAAALVEPAVPDHHPSPVPVLTSTPRSTPEPAPAPADTDVEVEPVAMGPELEPVELDDLAPEVEAPRGGGDRRRGPRFNFFTGTLLLAAVALFGGYLAVNLILMPSLTRQGAEVRVPEVIGFSEREAERLLAAEDLKLSKISEQWSPDVPRGFITAQDPPAGGVVKRGRRISVIVSLGAQGTSVPILEGVTARQAEILLEGAGLKLGRTARAYSDQVGKDLIIASDPPGETMVEQETSVDLLVSLGSPPRSFVLPDLTGRDAVAAARSLRDAGFSVSLREGGPRQKTGLVSAQDPGSGRRVAPRDSIVLYYHP